MLLLLIVEAIPIQTECTDLLGAPICARKGEAGFDISLGGPYWLPRECFDMYYFK